MGAGIKNFMPERLVKKRKEKGLSQSEAAKMMHLSTSGYHSFESGARIPGWQVLFVMAITLETSIEYLTGETDDPRPRTILTADGDPALADLISGYKKLSSNAQKSLSDFVSEITKKD